MNDSTKEQKWQEIMDTLAKQIAEAERPDAAMLEKNKHAILHRIDHLEATPSLMLRRVSLEPVSDLSHFISFRKGSPIEGDDEAVGIAWWRLLPGEADLIVTKKGPAFRIPEKVTQRCYPEMPADQSIGLVLTLTVTPASGDLVTPTLYLRPPPKRSAFRVVMQFADGLERTFAFQAPAIDSLEVASPPADPLPLAALGEHAPLGTTLCSFAIEIQV